MLTCFPGYLPLCLLSQDIRQHVHHERARTDHQLQLDFRGIEEFHREARERHGYH
jgi:hypothetical protein